MVHARKKMRPVLLAGFLLLAHAGAASAQTIIGHPDSTLHTSATHLAPSIANMEKAGRQCIVFDVSALSLNPGTSDTSTLILIYMIICATPAPPKALLPWKAWPLTPASA